MDIDIPVNPSSGSTSPSGIPAFDPPNGSAVFPLQIGLYRDGSNTLEGAQLTTFLVYAAGPQSSTSYPPLSVALIVPVHAAPVVDDPNGTVGTLGTGRVGGARRPGGHPQRLPFASSSAWK